MNTTSMTEAAIKSLVTRIRNHLGCSTELAAEYAADIGDTPETVNGQVVIRNAEGRIIASIPASVVEVDG